MDTATRVNTTPVEEIPQVVEEEVEIDVGYQINESIVYDEEIVDIEVEEVTLDCMEETSDTAKMEEVMIVLIPTNGLGYYYYGHFLICLESSSLFP